MKKKPPTTSVETLNNLLSVNAELLLKIASLQKEIELRESALAKLQTRLDQYWDLHEDIDYRHLVERIREEAHSVGEALRALDIGTRKALARLGSVGGSPEVQSNVPGKRLLPSVHSLLRTLNEWK